MREDVDSTTLEKWRNLTRLLVSLTKKGKMTWRETPRDDEFLTAHGNVVVVLRQTTSQNSPDDLYIVTIRDKEGKIVDSFDDEILDAGQTDTNYYVVLKDIMLGIRRIISGADETLDELLESLSEEDEEMPF